MYGEGTDNICRKWDSKMGLFFVDLNRLNGYNT